MSRPRIYFVAVLDPDGISDERESELQQAADELVQLMKIPVEPLESFLLKEGSDAYKVAEMDFL